MHVDQTVGVPPNHGSIYLAIMSWTWKSRNALTKIVRAYIGMPLFSFVADPLIVESRLLPYPFTQDAHGLQISGVKYLFV
jgi:hypothetical protein